MKYKHILFSVIILFSSIISGCSLGNQKETIASSIYEKFLEYQTSNKFKVVDIGKESNLSWDELLITTDRKSSAVVASKYPGEIETIKYVDTSSQTTIILDEKELTYIGDEVSPNKKGYRSYTCKAFSDCNNELAYKAAYRLRQEFKKINIDISKYGVFNNFNFGEKNKEELKN